MQYRYSAKADKDKAVKVLGRSLPISFKQSIEICNWLRKRNSTTAKQMLTDVIAMKRAVPYRRFTGDTGHKKSIGPGRYPVKACTELLELIKQAEAAATQKGLDVKTLTLSHLSSQKGSKTWHYGRKRRRQAKRTHIEIVALAEESKKAAKGSKTEAKKAEQTHNPDAKPARQAEKTSKQPDTEQK